MTEILTLLLVLHLHKIMYFLKMSKTHYKKNFLSPFKNILKIMSRRPCILRHIRGVPTSTPFAPFRLQTPPLSPFPFHVTKHMVFSTQDGPDPPKVLEIYHFYYTGGVGGLRPPTPPLGRIFPFYIHPGTFPKQIRSSFLSSSSFPMSGPLCFLSFTFPILEYSACSFFFLTSFSFYR